MFYYFVENVRKQDILLLKVRIIITQIKTHGGQPKSYQQGRKNIDLMIYCSRMYNVHIDL